MIASISEFAVLSKRLNKNSTSNCTTNQNSGEEQLKEINHVPLKNKMKNHKNHHYN
jgi:hypothetical protein